MSMHIPMQKPQGGPANRPGTIRVSELERALYDALKHRYQRLELLNSKK